MCLGCRITISCPEGGGVSIRITPTTPSSLPPPRRRRRRRPFRMKEEIVGFKNVRVHRSISIRFQTFGIG